MKDGVFRPYRGGRETNTFVTFVEEKKWEKIEPVSKWSHPASLQMSLVSSFFKISMSLRAVHNRLVEEWGIPQWGSYVLFALATILLGALLGVLIVCMIDILFPARPVPPEQRVRSPAGTPTREQADDADADGVRRRKAESDEKEPDGEGQESKKDS